MWKVQFMPSLQATSEVDTTNVAHAITMLQNIIVDDGHIYIVDFDWAGKVGEARYPIELYKSTIPNSQWHPQC